MNIVVKCMHGIGDSIYVRPFIKLLAKELDNDIYLDTPLPFLFEDLRVRFVETTSKYRTQKKALENIRHLQFVTLPNCIDREINYGYDHNALRSHGIVTHMEQAFGFEPGSTIPEYDLPWTLQKHGIQLPADKPVAVVRPVTYRNEWPCFSRAPKAKYVAWASKVLKDMGYFVISIADCLEGEEWIEDGGETSADLKLHFGELSISSMLSLLKSVDLVVGGSGFIVPATIAAKTPLFIIFGGRGGYDNPYKILDLRMNLKNVGWAIPDNFCRCYQMDHDCDKTISNLDSDFFNFVKTLSRVPKIERMRSAV